MQFTAPGKGEGREAVGERVTLGKGDQYCPPVARGVGVSVMRRSPTKGPRNAPVMVRNRGEVGERPLTWKQGRGGEVVPLGHPLKFPVVNTSLATTFTGGVA